MPEAAVVETTALRKVYRGRGRRVVAVDGLDLAVPAGSVHGFLGPNGSGKTSTLRMLLGLARPSGGEIRLFGRPAPAALAEVAHRIGAVVEEPKFSPSFTGRRNLLLLARAAGLGRPAVDRSLERVGLREVARERYSAYSLGMRQRLALAATLLRDPDLLILDEPTNGLDPAGIHEIRTLVTGLRDEGVTVLLSSHILAEVQQVCSSVSILEHGRLVAHGAVADLLGEGVSRTRVGVADPAGAAAVLRTAGYDVSTDPDDTSADASTLLIEGHDDPEAITRALAAHGHYVRELGAVRPTLEEVFLRLTGSPADAIMTTPAASAASAASAVPDTPPADEPEDDA